MKTKLLICILLSLGCSGHVLAQQSGGAVVTLPSASLKPLAGARALQLDGLFYETAAGRTSLPSSLTSTLQGARALTSSKQATMPDGRVVTVLVQGSGRNFNISLKAQPDSGITKWGLAMQVGPDEYFTGLMERVVDGPQAKSWAPGIKEAMDLRGQKVDMIIKPTTSVYAPYFLSSRGYAALVKGNWPGFYEFAVSDPDRVQIEFEGPSFEMKVYTASDPATLVRAHAIETGPPFMPPKWMFMPWRCATNIHSVRTITTAHQSLVHSIRRSWKTY